MPRTAHARCVLDSQSICAANIAASPRSAITPTCAVADVAGRVSGVRRRDRSVARRGLMRQMAKWCGVALFAATAVGTGQRAAVAGCGCEDSPGVDDVGM